MEGTDNKDIMNPSGIWAKIPGWILVLITFLLPIVFLPTALVNISLLKAVIFLGLLYIALFIWVITKFKDEKFIIPFNLLSLSALLIPLIYLISGFFSQNFNVSMFGTDFGFDSIMIFSSFFAVLLLGSSTIKDKKTTLYVYTALILSSILVVVVHILNIFFSGFLPNLGYFITDTSNTIGKWFDLGIFSGMIVILSLMFVEYIKVSSWLKWLIHVLFSLSLVLLILIGFQELWFVIGVFSLVFFIYFLVIHRINSQDKKVSVPVLSLITLVVSILFIIAGPKINYTIQNVMNLQFSDARPTFMTTARVIKDSLKSDPILGAGPARFSEVWVANKPIESNLSDFWNVDFRYGFGFIPTLMASTGVLGILSWLFFFAMLLITGFSALFKNIKDNLSKFILVSSFILSLYLWIMLIIYIPSYTTMFLTFLFTSIFFSSLHREKLVKVKEISIIQSPRHGFIYIFTLIIVLLLVIGAAYKVTSRVCAIFLDRDVKIAISEGNWSEAERKASSAVNIDMTNSRFHQLASVYQMEINEVMNNDEIEDDTKASLYQRLLSGAISANQDAITFDNTNYQNYIKQISLFLGLVNEDEPAIAEGVITLTEKVKELYPINPEVPLILARVGVASGDNESARRYINEALELKPNYTTAIFLLSQLEVSEGNIEAAISNVQVAASIRPNDSTIFFQLGLLYYQDEQYEKAVPAFERAVILSPYYSNAKYFLGLSYYQIGKKDKAIAQFKDLSVLNPENKEVIDILNNLKSGNSPFDDIEVDPEDREDLPIDEDDIIERNDTGISE